LTAIFRKFEYSASAEPLDDLGRSDVMILADAYEHG